MTRILIVCAILALLASLSACSTIPENWDNRLVCTVARDRLFTVNMLKFFGIATEISSLDREIVCGVTP